MNELISDISDLSAIESGNIHLSLGSVRLRSPVMDVVNLKRLTGNLDDISFEVIIAEDIYVQSRPHQA